MKNANWVLLCFQILNFFPKPWTQIIPWWKLEVPESKPTTTDLCQVRFWSLCEFSIKGKPNQFLTQFYFFWSVIFSRHCILYSQWPDIFLPFSCHLCTLQLLFAVLCIAWERIFSLLPQLSHISYSLSFHIYIFFTLLVQLLSIMFYLNHFQTS